MLCGVHGQQRGIAIRNSPIQAALLVLLLAGGQVRSSVTSRPPRPDTPATRPVRKDSRVEEDLARLLVDRPSVPVTPSRESEAESPAPYVPPDGSVDIDRRCRIVYRPDTGWYLLTFFPDEPNRPVFPRWVLPSRWLEQIESYIARTPQATFRVSTETTVYDDRIFVMLRKVSIIRPSRAGTTPPAPAKSPSSETPKAPSGTEQTDDLSSPDAVIRELRRDLPGKPVLLPGDEREPRPVTSVAPGGGEQISEDRGEMRIDRLVTIRPDATGDWKEARFESDNTLQDQPLRLLPCRLLGEAERILAKEKRKTIRLRVTGIVTEYKGHRYLLLRKVLLERNMGQF